MARSKETLVFVLDVSPAMHPYLKYVSKATSGVAERKLFHHRGDEVGLVLFGLEETDNDLQRDLGGYETIVSEPIRPIDGDLVKRLKSLPRGCYAADFVDAVVVAIDMIHKKFGLGKKGNKRICLITDGRSLVKEPESGSKMEQMEKIASEMEQQGLKFDAVIAKTDGKNGEERNENNDILEAFSARTQGEVVRVESPLYLLGALKPRTISPTTLYRGDFELTPTARVKVWVYKKASQERIPSLKIYSDKAPQSDEFASHVVKMDTDYKRREDPTVSVPKEQRAKGFYYGQQLIPVTPDMELSLKFTAEKGIKLLGFTESSNIPRHYYMKEPNIFLPEPGNHKSILAISALARALKDANMVAITRCVWRQGQTSVVLGVLTPNVASENHVADSFYFNVIPFAEDIREFGFPSFDDRPASQLPSNAQQDAADSLVEMLDLSPPNGMEALQPERTINPVLQRFYHFLYLKSTNGDAAVPPLDDTLKKIVEPDFSSEQDSFLKEFCSKFTLVNVQKSKSSEKFWRDKIADNEDVLDVEAAKVDDSSMSGLTFDSLSGRQVEEVGSLNPVQDFEALLARRDSDEWVGKAIRGMKKIIDDLLESAYKGNTYDKAMACLAALRKGCVVQEEPGEFNSFYRHIAEKCQGKRLNDFWEKIVSNRITLISKEEAPDSDVTQEAALAFLSSESIKEEVPEQPEEIDEMDALLGEAI